MLKSFEYDMGFRVTKFKMEIGYLQVVARQPVPTGEGCF